VCFGVHLFRGGRLLTSLSSSVRVFMVIGGTDVNENVGNVEKMTVMVEVAKKAEVVVCFTSELCRKFEQFFGTQTKTVTIFPSVFVHEKEDISSSSSLADESFMNLPFFLLPIGIREVKQPQYLIEAMEQRKKETLIICGPILSENCFQHLSNAMKGI
jgi:hypothetical protein